MAEQEPRYQDIALTDMSKGIDKSTHVSKIARDHWAHLLNVIYKKGYKTRRPGLVEFGDNLPLNGSFIGGYQITWNDGLKELYVLTTRDAYIYDSGNWLFVTERYNIGTVTTSGAGNRTVALTTGTWQTYWPSAVMQIGFDDTDPDSITTWYDVKQMDNAAQLTLAEDGPSKTDVTYVLRICFSGDKNDTFCVSLITDPLNNCAFVTNNVDRPRKIAPGANLVEFPGLSDVVCTAVLCALWFESRLVLYSVVESGTAYPHRVRRSVKGDAEDFTGAGSGYNDLLEAKGFIVWAEKLKSGVVVYKEHSILVQSYKGEISTGQIYSFDEKTDKVGLLAPKLLVPLSSKHLFAGKDSFYSFDGVSDPVPVKDWVNEDIFGKGSNIDWENVGGAFGCHEGESNNAFFFFPSTLSDGYNDICYALECSGEEFHYHEFSKNFSGFGFYYRFDNITWEDLVGSWADQTWRWNDRQLLANAPLMLLGDKDGYVYSYDVIATDDDGTDISQKMRLPQLESFGNKVRIGSIEFSAAGETTNLYYSTDEGRTWKLLKSFTLTDDFQKYMIAPHHTFKRVMYELRHVGNCSFNQAIVKARTVSDR